MNDIRTADLFCRTERLVGSDAMQRLAAARVLLFGVGGVGSWCAEALIRSGIGHLAMVDPDNVDPSNINRQLPALTTTVGRPKVEVMRERLLEINPATNIVFLTAWPDYSLKAWDTAASGFLVKPLIPEDVKAVLSKLKYPIRGLFSESEDTK